VAPALRRRLRIAAWIPPLIAIGMAARFGLDGALANLLGVALWSVLVYVLILIAAPDARPSRAGPLCCAIGWAVELFQLTPIPLALARVSVLFRLALGTHFDAGDLPAYALGALAAAGLHALLRRREPTTLPNRTG
jgi:hypothetical protein